MTERRWIRDLVQEALGLASASRTPEAVSLLEKGLHRARDSADSKAIVSLARNAGLLCYHLHDLRRAVDYYREALGSAPDDGYLYLALAEAYRVVGDSTEMRGALTSAIEIATQKGDSDLYDMACQNLDADREDGNTRGGSN